MLRKITGMAEPVLFSSAAEVWLKMSSLLSDRRLNSDSKNFLKEVPEVVQTMKGIIVFNPNSSHFWLIFIFWRLESVCPSIATNLVNNNDNNGRLDDREYYNDLPGKIPPDLPSNESSDKSSKENLTFQRLPTAAPRSAFKKMSSNEQNDPNLIDLNIDIQEETNTSVRKIESTQESTRLEPQYVNCLAEESNQIKINDSFLESSAQPIKDPFDMRKALHLIILFVFI